MTQRISYLLFCFFLLTTTQTHAATLKIATLSPDGTAWMKKMRHAAKQIAEQTGNRVKIKFYPGGVMGDESAILRKMRINQLQGAAVSSGALTRYYKDTSIYGMPFLFTSIDEVAYVRKHMDKLIIDGLAKKGFISFGLADSGFVYLFSNKPIYTIDDLRQSKFWVPDNAAASNTVKAFALKPIPLPFGDVLSGLQTNLIDTIISSPIAALALQWHTQVKYMTDMPILYSWGTLVISKRAMKKLKKQDQKIVHQLFGKAFADINRQNMKDSHAALAAIYNQGISFVKPELHIYQQWMNIAAKGNKRLISEGYNSQKMYDLLQKYLAEYRKQKQSNR